MLRQKFGHFSKGCHRERQRSDLSGNSGDCHAPSGLLMTESIERQIASLPRRTLGGSQ
jgi:hypothetical protein